MKFFDFIQKYSEEDFRFLKSGGNPFVFLEEYAISEGISSIEAFARLYTEMVALGAAS